MACQESESYGDKLELEKIFLKKGISNVTTQSPGVLQVFRHLMNGFTQNLNPSFNTF